MHSGRVCDLLRHGFYLAYYMFFIEWALFNDITKQFYKSKEKFKMIPKKL